MCCCGKPTINGQPGAYSWDGKTFSTRAADAPGLAERDALLYDEPGRCGGVDCHSHHFRLVATGFDRAILVKHGGGEERVRLPVTFKPLLPALAALDSNARFWLLHSLYSAHRDAQQEGAAGAESRYRQAFADGRLRKRKLPGRDACKIWIEPMEARRVSTL